MVISYIVLMLIEDISNVEKLSMNTVKILCGDIVTQSCFIMLLQLLGENFKSWN